MPSNRELAAEAEELGRRLGREVVCDGLTNAQRVELVEGLRREVESIGAQAENPPAPEVPSFSVRRAPENRDRPPVKSIVDGAVPDHLGGPPRKRPAPPAPPGTFPYAVAPGRVIECPRGRLVQGDEVRALDLVKNAKDVEVGKRHLEELVASGAVVKKAS